MTRTEILNAAEKCVNGEREQEYGSPEKNFDRIAEMWSCFLADKLKELISPSEVAAMMVLLKVSRIASGNARDDSWIDIAGYAACGGELEGGT